MSYPKPPKQSYAARQELIAKKKASDESKERLGILLSLFRETTNHLREENEDILLAGIFAEVDLPYIIKGRDLDSLSDPDEGAGEVLITAEELAEIDAAAEAVEYD